MNDADNVSGGTVQRWCWDCDDYTPHRQVASDVAPDPTYQCLACVERVEIEAALGINGRSRETDTDRSEAPDR